MQYVSNGYKTRRASQKFCLFNAMKAVKECSVGGSDATTAGK